MNDGNGMGVQMNLSQVVVALFSFEASSAEEMSFRKGMRWQYLIQCCMKKRWEWAEEESIGVWKVLHLLSCETVIVIMRMEGI